jgi:DNA polymerase delta subunit 1
MYTLNYFARKFCGLQKEDMDYREIPVLQAGSAEDRARLGSYCVKDSELCEDLNEARTMITEILQFSAVFGVLPEWVYFRGQQVRFVAQLLLAARTSEAVPLLLNRPPGGFHGEGTVTFQGATVNDPKRGFYRKAPVATLDWASLYPSIMCAHNLCHSTHVLDPKAVEGLSGVVAFDLGGGEVVRFATAARHKGILPRILEDLGGRRKVAKRRVKECAQAAKDPAHSEEEQRRFLALSKVFDGQQLALKVSMNSVYGACGAVASGKFPDLAISAAVTLQGRTAMEIKKAILPVRFPGIDVIYGDTDSVMVTFADAHDVQSCGERGEEASAFVTEHFASLGYPEMRLEFEKCFFPYLLEGKKRYAGLKFEMDVHGKMVCKGIDCKGIETERRDTLPFVKDIMHGCLDILMHQRDEQRAFAHFRQRMREFVAGEIPFDKFIMRKNLSAKAERKPDQLVQARVNALRRSRAPGSEAAVNEQVEYVIVNGWKGEKTTQLAEDPQFAREQGLKLNLLWYFEHAIVEPVRKLFAPLDGIDFEGACKLISLELDSRRLGVSSVVRDLLAGGGAGAAASGSAGGGTGATAGAEPSHVPCIIPARKKPRRPPRK